MTVPTIADKDERVPEYSPTFTLNRQIAEARVRMGPQKWARLNAEWGE